MKFVLFTALLFALGFFGTGLAINPNSPVNIDKLMAKKDTIEEVPVDDAIETIPDKKTSSVPEAETPNADANKETVNQKPVSTTSNQPVVTKRTADLSKPITLSSMAITISGDNIKEFLADKKPNLVLVGNFSSETSRDLVDSLNLLLSEFSIQGNVYVIDTANTQLPIDRGAIVIDDTFRLSLSASIYYQQGALVMHHRSLRNIDYNGLYQFFSRVYK